MPKAFSEDERHSVEQELLDAGLKRFMRHGIRSVRVEDLCADVGIAKGSFYAFFASKEELFMSIADTRDALHQSDLLAFLNTEVGPAGPILGRFFDMLISKTETDPVLRVITEHGELAHLVRKLPAERLAKNRQRDRLFLTELSQVLVTRELSPSITVETLEGLLALMLSLVLQKDNLPMGDYATTVGLLKEMFVQRVRYGSGKATVS